LPIDLWGEANSFFDHVLKTYSRHGQALVRIKSEVDGVTLEKGNFLVSVIFFNAGRYPVSIQTPDEWDKRWFSRLDVTGWSDSGEKKWHADLVGERVVNKQELSTWTMDVPFNRTATFVTVPAGGNVVFKIVAVPDDKTTKWIYKFSALINTQMITGDKSGEEIENGRLELGKVNFISSEMRTFTLDRDWPSTPDEWRDFEARKRAQLSGRIVRPGETFAESGYYQLVSDSGQRSQFVTEFRRGRTAEIGADSLDDQGKPFSGRTAWRWEADSALGVRCDPNRPCPRDGHWVAVTRDFGWLDKRYTLYADTKRYFSAGEIMPAKRNAYGDELRYLAWYWLGI
jgi:hypothetical protein